jgi:hypothetical protein
MIIIYDHGNRSHYTIETYLSLMYKVPPFLKGDV